MLCSMVSSLLLMVLISDLVALVSSMSPVKRNSINEFSVASDICKADSKASCAVLKLMASPFRWCGVWKLRSTGHGLAAQKLGADNTVPVDQEAV